VNAALAVVIRSAEHTIGVIEALNHYDQIPPVMNRLVDPETAHH
jgi:hypothetical protein